MTKQRGFYYDADRCIQCHTCEMACKDTRKIELGLRWRRVVETWEGEYPYVTRTFLSLSCLHCGEPACMSACPTGAIIKRVEDGIVVIDKAKCDGCRKCLAACPYDVPQFGNDGIMQKCDFCLEIAGGPACAAACPTEALRWGFMEDARLITGKLAERMDGPTEPSIIIVR